MSHVGWLYWLNTFIIIYFYSYPSHSVCWSVTHRLIPPWGPLTTSPLRSSCRLDTTSCATGGLWESSCMKCSLVRHTTERFMRSLGCKNQNCRCTNKPAVLRHHQRFLNKVVGSVQVTRPSAPRRRRRPTGRWWTGRRPLSSHLKSPSLRGPKTWYWGMFRLVWGSRRIVETMWLQR